MESDEVDGECMLEVCGGSQEQKKGGGAVRFGGGEGQSLGYVNPGSLPTFLDSCSDAEFGKAWLVLVYLI